MLPPQLTSTKPVRKTARHTKEGINDKSKYGKILYIAIAGRIFTRGEKLFELSNHLGNVLVTTSDKKIGVDQNSDGNVDYYNADVISSQDYAPFGSLMPGRKYSASNLYRYGFNGKERDQEVKGRRAYIYCPAYFFTRSINGSKFRRFSKSGSVVRLS